MANGLEALAELETFAREKGIRETHSSKLGRCYVFYKFLFPATSTSWEPKYHSPYQNFEYALWQVYEQKVDKDKNNTCSRGLNVATLDWVISTVEADKNLSFEKVHLIECFVPKDPELDYCIPYNNDGKLRVSKMLLNRKVEWEKKCRECSNEVLLNRGLWKRHMVPQRNGSKEQSEVFFCTSDCSKKYEEDNLRICGGCNGKYSLILNVDAGNDFCSRECVNKWSARGMRICESCRDEYNVTDTEYDQYCSYSCWSVVND